MSQSNRPSNTDNVFSQPSLGSRERRLLSETSHIEEELVPRFVRPVLFIVGALLILFLIWAAIAQMKEVARPFGQSLRTHTSPPGATTFME